MAIGERVGHEAVDITYHYAHLFPMVQTDMAGQLETEREALVNVRNSIKENELITLIENNRGTND